MSLSPMSVDVAKQVCMAHALGLIDRDNILLADGTIQTPYAAAVRLMSFARVGTYQSVDMFLSTPELSRWFRESLRENCAWALEEYAKAYPNG